MSGWTKGSRYWKIAPLFVLLAAGLAVWFEDASVFTNVTVTWMALAGGKSVVSSYKGTDGS